MMDLIFDGQCGFCTRSVQWLRRLDRHGRIRLHPLQDDAVLARFELTEEQARGAVWVIDAEGRRLQGAEAVAAAVDAALFPRRAAAPKHPAPKHSASNHPAPKHPVSECPALSHPVPGSGRASSSGSAGWCPFTAFYRLPGVRWAQDRLYRWVAENRYRLPGVTPWCQRHPEDCPDAAPGGSCSVTR